MKRKTLIDEVDEIQRDFEGLASLKYSHRHDETDNCTTQISH